MAWADLALCRKNIRVGNSNLKITTDLDSTAIIFTTVNVLSMFFQHNIEWSNKKKGIFTFLSFTVCTIFKTEFYLMVWCFIVGHITLISSFFFFYNVQKIIKISNSTNHFKFQNVCFLSCLLSKFMLKISPKQEVMKSPFTKQTLNSFAR